jgi:hypothetical protein
MFFICSRQGSSSMCVVHRSEILLLPEAVEKRARRRERRGVFPGVTIEKPVGRSALTA